MFAFTNIETKSRFLHSADPLGFKNIDYHKGLTLIISILTLQKSGTSIDIV